MLLVQFVGRQGCAGRRIIHLCPVCMPSIPCPASMPAIPCPACIIHFPGLHPGLICVAPLGQMGPGAVPGLHPGLVCAAPLGQMGPGAFSRRRRRRSWRGERGQRWTRHGTSRKCDGRLSASAARCCGGVCGFLRAGGAPGRRALAHRHESFDSPVAQPRLSRNCWVRATSVSRLSSAHMSRARSRRSAAWAVSVAVAVSPAVAVAVAVRCDRIEYCRGLLDR